MEQSPPAVLYVNPWTNRPTTINYLAMDRGMSFQVACQRLERERKSDKDGFWQSRREMCDPSHLPCLCTPSSCFSLLMVAYPLCCPSLHIAVGGCVLMCVHQAANLCTPTSLRLSTGACSVESILASILRIDAYKSLTRSIMYPIVFSWIMYSVVLSRTVCFAHGYSH